MEGIKEGQKVLVISNVLQEDDIQNALKVKDLNITHITPQQFTDENGSNPSTFDIVLPHSIEQNNLLSNLLSKILKSLKPGGTFIVKGSVKDYDNIEFELKINGFVNVKVEGDRISAAKPNYEIGSAAKLKLNSKPVKSVWKIDADDEEVETIDPDNLLDEDDLKKPDPSALRVCGTTGKRKACKDCSCGLADELEAEIKGKLIDTTDFPKSSCGSCYLGDAFRCSTCPYLGMPAFKPGEKIQLSENFLKSDI